MTLLAKASLFLFSNSACANERKTAFCEVESVIITYLKIVANLLHGGKHAVNKAE